MPTISEIQDQWPLFAVVLAIGFVAGWFGRQLLLRYRKKPVSGLLYEVHGKFRNDEEKVDDEMDFIAGQIWQMRAGAEAQRLAAELTARKMEQLHTFMKENYFSNEIPNKLGDVSQLVQKLEAVDEANQKVARLS